MGKILVGRQSIRILIDGYMIIKYLYIFDIKLLPKTLSMGII